jgi:hypothetical protein
MRSPSTLDMEEPPRPKKVKNILDYGEEEIGEVAEWVNHTSNKNKKDNIYSDSESEENNSDFQDVFEPQTKIENSLKKTNDKNINSTPQSQKMSVKREEPFDLKREKEKSEEKKIELEMNKHEIENFEDWDEISKKNLALLVSPNVLVQSESDFSPIFFPEAWQIIKNLDLSKERKSIVVSDESNESIFKRYFPCIVKRMSNSVINNIKFIYFKIISKLFLYPFKN